MRCTSAFQVWILFLKTFHWIRKKSSFKETLWAESGRISFHICRICSKFWSKFKTWIWSSSIFSTIFIMSGLLFFHIDFSNNTIASQSFVTHLDFEFSNAHATKFNDDFTHFDLSLFHTSSHLIINNLLKLIQVHIPARQQNIRTGCIVVSRTSKEIEKSHHA